MRPGAGLHVHAPKRRSRLRMSDLVTGARRVASDVGWGAKSYVNGLTCRAVALCGAERGSGSPLNLLYVGNGSTLAYFRSVAFSSAECNELSYKGSPLGLSRLIRQRQDAHDLILIDTVLPFDRLSVPAHYLRLPRWIKQILELETSWEGVQRNLRERLPSKVRSRLRSNGYRVTLVSSPEARRSFYRHLYRFHILERFGDASIIDTEARFLRQTRSCYVLQAHWRGEIVAGVILRPAGQELTIFRFGMSRRAHAEGLKGLTDVLDFFSVRYAFDQGFSRVNFGSSRPNFDDGVLKYKLKWGTRIEEGSAMKPDLRLSVNRWNPGVRSLLRRNRFIVRGDRGLAAGGRYASQRGRMSLAWFFQRDPVLLFPTGSAARLHRPEPPRPRETNRVASWSRSDRVFLTFSGSAAIFQAARALELGAGATVLCPAYNCGHELEPLLRNGASLRFYKVDRQLHIDLEDFRSKIDPSVRGVLVTHYFGFPQDLGPVRRLCDENDLQLIEDCAHSLVALETDKSSMGGFGDAVVYSMRKTHGLTDGGALVLRRTSDIRGLDLQPANRIALRLKELEILKKRLLRAGSRPGWLLSRLVLLALAPAFIAKSLLKERSIGGPLIWCDPDDQEFDYDGKVLSWWISSSARKTFINTDPGAIRAVRRRNFEHLLKALGDHPRVQCLLTHLPAEVCPLWFPLLVEDTTVVIARLSVRGISSAAWWDDLHPAVPWADFPDASHLKRHAIILPIHQEVEPHHLERIVAAVREAVSSQPV